MGSYGIGIGRNLAAAVEANHDDAGIVWPVEVAPFEVVVTAMQLDDATLGPAEQLYADLKAAGVEALLDDRDAPRGEVRGRRTGGFPIRLTVGPGPRERHRRDGRTGQRREARVPLGEIVATVTSRLDELRATMPE